MALPCKSQRRGAATSSDGDGECVSKLTFSPVAKRAKSARHSCAVGADAAAVAPA